jgi:hypothetical protein
MKKSLIATLVAAPVLAMSASAFAAEPVELTATQLDTVTAGQDNESWLGQINISPVTVTQLNILTDDSSNTAFVLSGNFASVHQHQHPGH